MKVDIPAPVQKALSMLESAGYEAYIVGGCVRDSLLGTNPDDYDITTSALPEQTAHVFAGEKIIATGLKHGTQTVIIDGMPLEITTYRVESGYSDSRHPDSVSFTRSLKEDVMRRDFTMNAIACGRDGCLADYCGGEQDIRDGIIRCVGDAETRFTEDALRIMRALRFSSVLGFEIEEKTRAAAFSQKERLKNVSAERLYVELVKLLCGKNVRCILIEYVEILAAVIPELLPMKGFDQHNEHHIYNVLKHTAAAVESVPPVPSLRLAALLHDIGKPSCFTLDEAGVGHFYGHPKVSHELAVAILRRLRASGEIIETVSELVRLHDVPITDDGRIIKRRLSQMPPELFFSLLELMRADTRAQAPEYLYRLDEYDKIEQSARRILEEKQCFSLHDLAVKGGDLMKCGLPQGKQIGVMLGRLLDAVIAGTVQNDKEELLALAQRLNRQNGDE